MYNIIEALHQNISKEKSLISSDDKLYSRFYLNPSSSMSYSSIDGSPIGACIKQVWLDKKNYPITNPITTYNEYIFEAGRLWEKWLIDQYKSMGIYLDNSVKIVDNELGISGEIDILHKNPEDNSIEVTECKTYNGSFSYVTSEVLGTDKEPPKPKDSYLLQCVTYLLILRKYNISKINLIYLDRSVSKIWNHKQFLIYLDGNKIYYDTYFKNKLITIEEDRFTIDNILEKNQVLFELLESDYVPDPDYKLMYTLESLKEDHSKGLITTTEFNKVMKGNKDVSEVCSWQCAYCKFGKNPETGESTCLNTVN